MAEQKARSIGGEKFRAGEITEPASLFVDGRNKRTQTKGMTQPGLLTTSEDTQSTAVKNIVALSGTKTEAPSQGEKSEADQRLTRVSRALYGFADISIDPAKLDESLGKLHDHYRQLIELTIFDPHSRKEVEAITKRSPESIAQSTPLAYGVLRNLLESGDSGSRDGRKLPEQLTQDIYEASLTLTQANVAEVFGMSAPHVSRIVRDHKKALGEEPRRNRTRTSSEIQAHRTALSEGLGSGLSLEQIADQLQVDEAFLQHDRRFLERKAVDEVLENAAVEQAKTKDDLTDDERNAAIEAAWEGYRETDASFDSRLEALKSEHSPWTSMYKTKSAEIEAARLRMQNTPRFTGVKYARRRSAHDQEEKIHEASSTQSYAEIAEKFGMSVASVSRIVGRHQESLGEERKSRNKRTTADLQAHREALAAGLDAGLTTTQIAEQLRIDESVVLNDRRVLEIEEAQKILEKAAPEGKSVEDLSLDEAIDLAATEWDRLISEESMLALSEGSLSDMSEYQTEREQLVAERQKLRESLRYRGIRTVHRRLTNQKAALQWKQQEKDERADGGVHLGHDEPPKFHRGDVSEQSFLDAGPGQGNISFGRTEHPLFYRKSAGYDDYSGR